MNSVVCFVQRLAVFELDLDPAEDVGVSSLYSSTVLYGRKLGDARRSGLPIRHFQRYLRRYVIEVERGVLTPASVARHSRLGVFSPFATTKIRQTKVSEGVMRRMGETHSSGSSFLKMRPFLPHHRNTNSILVQDTVGIQGADVQRSSALRSALDHRRLPPSGTYEGRNASSVPQRPEEDPLDFYLFSADRVPKTADDDYLNYADMKGIVNFHMHVDFTQPFEVNICPAALEEAMILLENFVSVPCAPWTLMDTLERALLGRKLRQKSEMAAKMRKKFPDRSMMSFALHHLVLRSVQAIRYAPLQSYERAGSNKPRLGFAPKLATGAYVLGITGNDMHGFVVMAEEGSMEHIAMTTRALDLTLQELQSKDDLLGTHLFAMKDRTRMSLPPNPSKDDIFLDHYLFNNHPRWRLSHFLMCHFLHLAVPLDRLPSRLREAARSIKRHKLLLALSLSNLSLMHTKEYVKKRDAVVATNVMELSLGDIASSMIDRSMINVLGMAQAWEEVIARMMWASRMSSRRIIVGLSLLLDHLIRKQPMAFPLHEMEEGEYLSKFIDILLPLSKQEQNKMERSVQTFIVNMDRKLTGDHGVSGDEAAHISHLAPSELVEMNMQRVMGHLPEKIQELVNVFKRTSDIESDKNPAQRVGVENIRIMDSFSCRLSLGSMCFWIVDTAEPLTTLPYADQKGEQPKFKLPTEEEIIEQQRFIHGFEFQHSLCRAFTVVNENSLLGTDVEGSETFDQGDFLGSEQLQSAGRQDTLFAIVNLGRVRIETSPGVFHVLRYLLDAMNRAKKMKDTQSSLISTNGEINLPVSHEHLGDFAASPPQPKGMGDTGTGPKKSPLDTLKYDLRVHGSMRELQVIASAPGSGMTDTAVRGISFDHFAGSGSDEAVLRLGGSEHGHRD
jgi:hypothetical protein